MSYFASRVYEGLVWQVGLIKVVKARVGVDMMLTMASAKMCCS